MVELVEVPYAYVKCIWRVPWVPSFTLIKLSVSKRGGHLTSVFSLNNCFLLIQPKKLRNFSYSIVILANFFGQIFDATKLKRKTYSGDDVSVHNGWMGSEGLKVCMLLEDACIRFWVDCQILKQTHNIIIKTF
jgi:hypothetical protein